MGEDITGQIGRRSWGDGENWEGLIPLHCSSPAYRLQTLALLRPGGCHHPVKCGSILRLAAKLGLIPLQEPAGADYMPIPTLIQALRSSAPAILTPSLGL